MGLLVVGLDGAGLDGLVKLGAGLAGLAVGAVLGALAGLLNFAGPLGTSVGGTRGGGLGVGALVREGEGGEVGEVGGILKEEIGSAVVAVTIGSFGGRDCASIGVGLGDVWELSESG